MTASLGAACVAASPEPAWAAAGAATGAATGAIAASEDVCAVCRPTSPPVPAGAASRVVAASGETCAESLAP